MRRWKRFVFAAIAMGATLFVAAPAMATVVSPTPLPGAKAGNNTDMTLTGIGPNRGVDGFIADPGTPFDPTAGYPAGNPGAGFTPRSEGIAGVIFATPVGGGTAMSMYCIDILTDTNIGVGYKLGTWETAGVPNVGYVTRILNNYYPNTNEPAGLLDANDKAAAVQAAIWFFTDRYVLNTSETVVRPAVMAIVTAVLTAGPVPTPTPPSLTIAPTTISKPQGTVIGPFTVMSNATTTSVAATGAEMFADAGATVPIANGQAVPSGQTIWLKSTGQSAAKLFATASATVPSGNVYLYDGNTPGKTTAQRLILAQTATLRTTVNATADFLAPGSLTVTKTIAGPGAGLQGPITITVTCNGTQLTPVFTIPASAPAGSTSQTYTDIPAQSVCTVRETADGHTATLTSRRTGDGTTVDIPAGGTVTVPVTDTFETGSLIVNKTISGDGAGQQGPITISVTCGGVAKPDFAIPAGAPSGSVSQAYPGILAGTVCTVTETANGATSTVDVITTGTPQNVTIGANGSGTANIGDDYELIPGSLVVTKTLAGPAAGQQGVIAVLVDCGAPPNIYSFSIDPNTPAGAVPHAIDGIPANSVCTVTETLNGSTSTVSVVTVGSGQQVTVGPAATASADLTNTFDQVTTTTTPTTTAPVQPTEPSVLPTSEPATLPRTGGGGSSELALGAIGAAAVGALLVLVGRRRGTPLDD